MAASKDRGQSKQHKPQLHPVDEPDAPDQPALNPNGAARSPAGFQTPPHNLQVELRLLGILMVNNAALGRVRDRLRPEHFYEPRHAAFYAGIRGRIIDGRLADVDALSASMDPSDKQRMYDLAAASAGSQAEDIDQCADELIALWQRRKAIELSETLRNASYDLDVSAAEWRLRLIQDLNTLEAESPSRRITPPPHIDLSRLSLPLPDRRFMVPDWIPVGYVTSIYGEGSAGKSFLAMILGTCLSAGIPWLGVPVARCRVLSLFCEDNEDELLIRQNKILRGLALKWSDVADHLFMCDRVGSPNSMMTFEQGRPLDGPAMQDILAKIDEVKPRLLILDNIGHLYGGNENDRFQVTTFLNRLSGLARQMDGAVVLLGHPPKNEAQYSGSTAWSNNVRSRVWLEKCKDDEDRWILKRAKTNYAEPCDLMLIRDPITGLVRPDDPAYESEDARHEAERKLGSAREHLKSAIDALNSRGINTAPDKRAQNHLLRVLEEEGMTAGFKRRVLERALQTLLADSSIAYDAIGQHPKGKPVKTLVRTAAYA